MAVAEVTSVLTAAGTSIAAMGRSLLDCEPVEWSASLDWTIRSGKLADTYGQRGAMPKKWVDVSRTFLDSLSPERLRECEELLRLGMERKAIRLAYCRKLASLYACKECGRPAKKISNCKNRMCEECAAKNFDALFKKFSKVDSLIPATVRSLPGWGWHVLDFSFKHDGDFPKQWELRAMVGIIRRTVERAVREARPDWYNARWEKVRGKRRPCPLRINGDDTPMTSVDGWPIVGTREGEARELIGWTVVNFAAHKGPDNAARKRGERGAKKDISERRELRFGYNFIRVTEFGFDSVNAHFHGAYFGPRLNYGYEMKCRSCGRKIERDGEGRFECKCGGRCRGLNCWGRLVEIFKQESAAPISRRHKEGCEHRSDGHCMCPIVHPSRGGLGEESYTVFFEPARRGFRSVLAHALKYTKKIPTSTPEGYAKLEHALQGTRRVALLGMHYGVPLKPDPRPVKCPKCGGELERVKGVGLVLLSDVADLPDAIEERRAEDDEDGESDSGAFAEEGRAP